MASIAPYPGSTTDHAAQIRAALKTKGWTARDVSVRAEYYSLGSSIHIVIKNPAVPLHAVETIANDHERIDRDGSGEILSGANRFVYVRYSDAANEALSTPLLPMLTAAAQQVQADPNPNSLHEIGATGYRLGRGYNGWGVSLWGDGGHMQTANDPAHLAQYLAVALQARPLVSERVN